MHDKNILIIDDDVDILNAAKLLLKRHFQKVEIEKNPDKIPYLVNNFTFDVILLDMNFSRDVNTGNEGFFWLDFILDKKKDQKVILFTAFGGIEMAVRAIKNGASDFILKPWINDKLLETLSGVFSKKDQKEIQEAPTPQSIIGESEEMKKVAELIKQVAATDANILILGENGTGKDLVAREIHQFSKRKDKKFVHADLGSVSENLFESELFGHVKGAFTDAREERTGRFQEADKGTIFLDEIGNVPMVLQNKLLFALQNRNIVKVGSNTQVPFDARLICATNEAIYERVEEKTFRQDLLFRINTIEINLPPLRERGQDILLLAEHFLGIYAKKYNRKIKGLSGPLQKKLMAYHWPGNVRELQHVIERAVIITQNTMLNEDDFVVRKTNNTNNPVVETYYLEDLEKQLIIKTLKKHNGNITDASKEMGISRQALYRRIEKFNL
ncbi:sigma-54-dependent transcriptional regulator [Lacihabitans soyangensis]|uniref:Sigma-54-dependent Fis family transcriptional regulator n=1 Tax=Lacihabitans soyangensis TaxID=869394 RepID=A0AAE3H880_9BACT|nr:sigma-54 dependent transcriptional regulator [Lacihabitans soyangensis]MCP9765901.1 sigma-54-dependent Fis family transcriptional regulator [Lacihabitans soyangensis]